MKSKGERISQFVEQLPGEAPAESAEVSANPYYRAFFRCWNEQQYYEAHDVLEHVWLQTTSEEAQYFKGLIQAAGAFVHLQKQFEHPTHPKHGRRLAPALRLFRLASRNLEGFQPSRHHFDVRGFLELLREYAARIADANSTVNPWSPETAPKLRLL